jgi:hypothetical protein
LSPLEHDRAEIKRRVENGSNESSNEYDSNPLDFPGGFFRDASIVQGASERKPSSQGSRDEILLNSAKWEVRMTINLCRPLRSHVNA